MVVSIAAERLRKFAWSLTTTWSCLSSPVLIQAVASGEGFEIGDTVFGHTRGHGEGPVIPSARHGNQEFISFVRRACECFLCSWGQIDMNQEGGQEAFI